MPVSFPPTNTNYQAEPSQIPVGPSPFVYRNTSGSDETVIVNAGVNLTLAWSRDGTNYHTLGVLAGMFHLSPGDYLKVIYVQKPTLTSIPR